MEPFKGFHFGQADHLECLWVLRAEKGNRVKEVLTIQEMLYIKAANLLHCLIPLVPGGASGFTQTLRHGKLGGAAKILP